MGNKQMIYSKIKDWYSEEYPDDELGLYVEEGATFMDLKDCLDNYQNVYQCIGVADSIIRERCFKKLAEIMEVDYEYIYNQWLKY